LNCSGFPERNPNPPPKGSGLRAPKMAQPYLHLPTGFISSSGFIRTGFIRTVYGKSEAGLHTLTD
jgi:hypothetical protein